ncbi:hypothetical protein GUITHDRAFT_104790 [Guillardia theta CCMP2712]|uniref:Uncharacterized protein n=2 Tax=Guillardia theta TaxID=55529 RepID=L1JLN6_GUITC|nr:hypothetical protein GUITHDRAFT_104790 [Guillardia theta CCMP2712]EKX49262.1 hypothetical protein GUITHDRAFT_104790 [Guillardia theta CCMP2712]|eukprot:XP_005836242.1 hypothetical protein GUITHDRAFT_104790 [Guillardia theta CCMP2712]
MPTLFLRPASALTEAEEFEKLQRRAAELREIFESQKAANSNLPTLQDSVARDKVAKGQVSGSKPEESKLLPSPSLTSVDVAKLLIAAMQKNDKPAPDSGLKAVLRFSSEKNPVKSMPEDRFFNMMKNSKYSILLADEYSFSVAKADEGVSKDDGEPFQVLDVKIKAPYKKMLMNGMQFEDFESLENDKENVQVSMKWQFSKSKESNCWLSDTLYVVSSSKNDAWRALV